MNPSTVCHDLHVRVLAEIDRLHAVEQAATAGPWRRHDTWLPHGGYAATVMSGHGSGIDIRAWLPTFNHEPGLRERNVVADAALIADARNTFPGLLAIARDVLVNHRPGQDGWCGSCDENPCRPRQSWPCPDAQAVLDAVGLTTTT